MKILQQLTNGAGATLPDSDDAHLTVELLYQLIAEQKLDKQGLLHISPIDLMSQATRLSELYCCSKKIRADVGAKQDEITLTGDQFETALENLKRIFEDHFLHNKDLAHDLHRKRTDPKALSRKEKKQINDDFRGAFAFALLRHGIFDFSDMRKSTQALRQEISDVGGISQSARHTPNPELRDAALKARRQIKYAKKCAM